MSSFYFFNVALGEEESKVILGVANISTHSENSCTFPQDGGRVHILTAVSQGLLNVYFTEYIIFHRLFSHTNYEMLEHF